MVKLHMTLSGKSCGHILQTFLTRYSLTAVRLFKSLAYRSEGFYSRERMLASRSLLGVSSVVILHSRQLLILFATFFNLRASQLVHSYTPKIVFYIFHISCSE